MRRTFCLILFLAAAVATASAQAPVQPSQFPPGLRLDESTWVPVHPTFMMGNMFGSSSGGRTHPTPLPGNRLSYGSNAPVAGSSGVSYGPRALWFRASAKLTNEGNTAIKSIRMEFIFTDPATNAEVLRIKHRSKKHLKINKSFEYVKTVKSSERTRRGKGATMRVEITEVVYADKTIWRP